MFNVFFKKLFFNLFNFFKKEGINQKYQREISFRSSDNLKKLLMNEELEKKIEALEINKLKENEVDINSEFNSNLAFK